MAHVRDFTDEARVRPFELIDEASNHETEWWGGVSSCLYGFAMDAYVNLGAISQYESLIHRYHQFIIDKKGIGKAQIDAIWKQVYECEDEHVAKARVLQDRLREATAEYVKMAEIIDCNRADGFMLIDGGIDFKWLLHSNFNVEKEYDFYLKLMVDELKDSDRFKLTDEEWAAMDYDARVKYLEDFYEAVKEIMDLGEDVTIRFEELEYDRYGEAGSESWVPYIAVDIRTVELRDLSSLQTTIIHECRHVYQIEVIDDRTIRELLLSNRGSGADFVVTFGSRSFSRSDAGPVRHPFTGDHTAYEWSRHRPVDPSTDYIGYLSSTREYDAFSFSGALESQDAIDAFFGSGINIDDINPVYRGSWE